MKFENLKKCSEKDFRRLVGVQRNTFQKMVEIVKNAKEQKTKGPGGRPSKVSIENKILMTLEYLREYRTYAHIGISYGLSESKTFTNIRWIEDVLIQSREFSLPGKKALLKSDFEFEVVLVDATESPIERPKKNNVDSILEKRKNIR